MAHPDQSQRPLIDSTTAHAQDALDPAKLRTTPRFAPVLIAFAVAALLCVLIYLAFAVPRSWFPAAKLLVWPASELALSHGTGTMEKGEMVLTAPDATGTTVLALNATFRSSDYPGISWVAVDVADTTKVDLLWRTDYTPDRVSALPLHVESGRIVPLSMAGNPAWIGNITGLALSLRGPLPQPVRVRGVTASPLGAFDLLRDRMHEWLAIETWSGTSINTVTGGADVQSLPLPVLLAVAATLAAAVCWFAYRRGWSVIAVAPPIAIGGVFITAWLLLDARWMWNLVRQTDLSAEQYAGKDWHAKHLVADDAELFAFIEKVRAKLPPPPARVIVMADEPYFRGRAAYHLSVQRVLLAFCQRDSCCSPAQAR